MTNPSEPVRINKYNFEELVPNSPIKFGTLIAAAYCPYHTMQSRTNFANIRYLTYNDIINFMEDRIRRTGNPMGAKANTTVWRAKKLIEIAKKMKENQ